MSPPSLAARRARCIVLVSLAVTLLVVAPAAAHPFFRGGEAPVASLATLTLDLAHGCASEVAGAGADTLEVALDVPDWLHVVEVPEPDGWVVDLEGKDGEVAVVSWIAAGAREPAPVFEFDAVIDGAPGEERHLAVFQSCQDRVHRWIGTPEAPADEPAVRLRLVAADQDRPPPASGRTNVDESDVVAGDGEEDVAAPDPATPPDATDATDAGDGTDAAASSAADSGSWWPAVAALALALVGWVAVRRRKQLGA